MLSDRLANGDLLLRLPLPDQGISPNARRGESRGAAIRKSRLVKKHRLVAMIALRNLLLEHAIEDFPAVGYRLAFFWKTAAFRDDDNADASCKAYRDGIADALRMDDRKLRKLALSTHVKDAQCPRVEITISNHSPQPEPTP